MTIPQGIVQRRVQRTYEVALLELGTGEVKATERVNLSYVLDGDSNALNLDGDIVEAVSAAAHVEAARRLEKLAKMGETHVTPEQMEALDWDVTGPVRQRFVEVPCDETGRPIPRRKQKEGQ